MYLTLLVKFTRKTECEESLVDLFW